MILQSIIDHVLQAGRVEQSSLLTYFHLRQEGLAPMMEVLLKLGKIQKTVHQRAGRLSAFIYYSCPAKLQIPTITII